MPEFEYKVLYFFKQTGCPVCAQAEPVVDAWHMAHPEIQLIKLNVANYPWEKLGYSPKAVPAYLFAVNNQIATKPFEGFITKPKGLDDFCGLRKSKGKA